MAHNLKKNTNGEIAMLYTGTTPWHGLGTACLDSFHSHEAMKAFPFTYSTETIHRPSGQIIEGKQAIVISDTNEVVGVTGDGYEIVQPQEAFDFMDSISESGRLKYKTVGALGKGERIWLLAHTPDNIWEPIKGDPIEDYLLFDTTYDGTGANSVRGTSITVVCQNTLNMAVGESKSFISIKHTVNVRSRLNMAAEIMQSYERQNKSFREAMKYLVKHPITDQLINEFEVSMFGDLNKEDLKGRGRTILQNKIDKYEELLVTGKGTEIKGRAGTAYGALQAYTEWSDWYSTVKGNKDADGKVDRTNAIVFGMASKEKVRAMDTMLELVGVRK